MNLTTAPRTLRPTGAACTVGSPVVSVQPRRGQVAAGASVLAPLRPPIPSLISSRGPRPPLPPGLSHPAPGGQSPPLAGRCLSFFAVSPPLLSPSAPRSPFQFRLGPACPLRPFPAWLPPCPPFPRSLVCGSLCVTPLSPLACPSPPPFRCPAPPLAWEKRTPGCWNIIPSRPKCPPSPACPCLVAGS